MLDIIYGKTDFDLEIYRYKDLIQIPKGTKMIISPTKRGGIKLTTQTFEHVFEAIVWISSEKMCLLGKTGKVLIPMTNFKRLNNFKELNRTLTEFIETGLTPIPDKISFNKTIDDCTYHISDIARI